MHTRRNLSHVTPVVLPLAALTLMLTGAEVRTVLADSSNLQQDVDALRNVGVTGVLAQVLDRGRASVATAGVAELGTTLPVPADGQYRAGSLTKTFVATSSCSSSARAG